MHEGACHRTVLGGRWLDARRVACVTLVLLLVVSGRMGLAQKKTDSPSDSASSISSPEAVPIAQARRDKDKDYVPDRIGDTVTVRGRVSMQPDVHINGRLIFIQDETAGIAVEGPDDPAVKRGDSLRVTGIVQHRNGLALLQELEYDRVEAEQRMPTPVPVTVSVAHADTYEGQLTRIRGRIVANQSNEGGKYLLIEDDGQSASEQIAVFVPDRHRDEIPLASYERGTEIIVTGILSQYDRSAPYDEYYQVLPREEEDLETVGFMSAYYQTIIFLIVAGVVLVVIVVFTLRTAVRRRTKQLAESRARFRRLAEATFEGIVIHEDGEILDVNRALIDMIGYDREELVGREFRDVLSESTRDLEQKIESSDSDETYEVIVVRKDGSSFPAEIEVKEVNVTDRDVRVAAIRNVTERKKWETEILLAKEKAEEMSRLKSSLLNNMSHELRTPITSIIGYAEIIMNEPDSDHHDFADRIRESGKRLSRTLQSVLEMAQLESGTLKVQPQDAEVGPLVREVVEENRSMAARQGLSLELNERTTAKTLYTDQSLLYRVLDNLIHNAIKFTKEGTIRVNVEPADAGVRIAVSDPGIGIDPEFREHLFEPFKQESEGRGRTHEGTGLGLALTKRMLDLIGGTIEVESVKGEGSTFVIEVPPIVPSEEIESAPAVEAETA